MNLKYLNRSQYLISVQKMDHYKTLRFAKHAMEYWDNYYSWEKFPCLSLCNNDGKSLCYLFYNINKENTYLTISYIFTPYNQRLKGYAKELLTQLFQQLSLINKVKRVKISCVSSSLKFYMNLGIDFWGVNSKNEFYTNFAMPTQGIDQIKQLMKEEHLDVLGIDELKTIFKNLQHNGSDLDEKQHEIYQNCRVLLGKRYRFDELFNLTKKF